MLKALTHHLVRSMHLHTQKAVKIVADKTLPEYLSTTTFFFCLSFTLYNLISPIILFQLKPNFSK